MRLIRLLMTLAMLAGVSSAGTLPNGASDLLYRGGPVNLCYTSLPPLCIVNGVLTVVPFNPTVIPLGNDELDIFTASFSFDVLAGGPIAPGPYNLTGTTQIFTPGFLGGPGPYVGIEMLQMNLNGGGILLRESPTLPSLGESPVSTVAGPGGNYTIPSFFDVFTEISLDSGSTWNPSPSYHVVMPEPAAWVLAGGALIALGLIRRRR